MCPVVKLRTSLAATSHPRWMWRTPLIWPGRTTEKSLCVRLGWTWHYRILQTSQARSKSLSYVRSRSQLLLRSPGYGIAICDDGHTVTSLQWATSQLHIVFCTCRVFAYTLSSHCSMHIFVSTDPPVINTSKLGKEIPVFRGYPEELVCEADGSPPPNIQWSSDKGSHESGSKLTVTEAGAYNCTARNRAGSTSHVVHVILKGDVYCPWRMCVIFLQKYIS